MDLYFKTKKELAAKIKELKAQGYDIKRGENQYPYFYAHLNDDTLVWYGKCGFCGLLIDIHGIFAHGRKCEACGETVALDYRPGDRIRFKFRTDQRVLGGVTMILDHYDEESQLLFLKKKLPKNQDMGQEKAYAYLEQHQDEYQEIDGCIAIAKSASGMDSVDSPIDIYDRGGFKNAGVVKVFEGKEYGEYEHLPIPESITLWEDWKIPKTAREIMRRSGVNPRPEYYSGRGATVADLNSEMLEDTYVNVQWYHGKRAAKAFVQMVKDIPVLSAADFAKTFLRLEANNWKWDKALLLEQKPRRIVSYDHWDALMAVVGAICEDYGLDDTPAIKGAFLSKYLKGYQGERMIFVDGKVFYS